MGKWLNLVEYSKNVKCHNFSSKWHYRMHGFIQSWRSLPLSSHYFWFRESTLYHVFVTGLSVTVKMNISLIIIIWTKHILLLCFSDERNINLYLNIWFQRNDHAKPKCTMSQPEMIENSRVCTHTWLLLLCFVMWPVGGAVALCGCRLQASSACGRERFYSQWEGQNRGSCVTFNHASSACLMISISVENNSNKCQMQDPTQSLGHGAHSHIGPR